MRGGGRRRARSATRSCVARPCRWKSEVVSGKFGEISRNSSVYGKLARRYTKDPKVLYG